MQMLVTNDNADSDYVTLNATRKPMETFGISDSV